jgi:2-iminobutanoate/2-iminopropanoate deaminase
MKKIIETNNAPSAVGPYSQGVEANDTLFVSMQIPFVPETMTCVGDDIESQTRRCLENIKGIVEEAGYEVDDIVKCQCFLEDINDFVAMNVVYEKFFEGHKPARSVIEASKLPKGAKICIDAVAVD